MRAQTESTLSRRSLIAAGLSSGAPLACPSVLCGLAEVAVEPQAQGEALKVRVGICHGSNSLRFEERRIRAPIDSKPQALRLISGERCTFSLAVTP
jgi:hypothetical protein